jgi:hypothetical protein
MEDPRQAAYAAQRRARTDAVAEELRLRGEQAEAYLRSQGVEPSDVDEVKRFMHRNDDQTP